jgi:multidrug efflux pump subunit AcrA (membrane-fusion protein)
MHKTIERRDNTYNLNDVLGPPPKGLSYYGSGLIFVIVLLLILISSVVKYPETVKSEVYLTSENPPRKIVAPISSYIDSIHVLDGSFVVKDQLLMTFINNSKSDDIKYLEQNILSRKCSYFLSDNSDLPDLQLGNIQSNYDNFKKQLDHFRYLKKSSSYLFKVNSLNNQIEICTNKRVQIKKNISLLDKKVSLSKKINQTDSILNDKGYIANMSYHELQMKDINNGFDLNEERKEMYDIDFRIQELKQNLSELTILFEEELRNEEMKVKITLNGLVNKYKTWQDSYTIKSVVSGIANFNNKHWVKGTFIDDGDELLKITPREKGGIIAFAKISDKGSSNVKKGQKVNIKLNNYPYKEYGILVGEIVKVVETPSSDNYLVHISFPEKIKTSYGKEIEFRPQMRGVADILTKEQSLLSKVFQEIKAIIVN